MDHMQHRKAPWCGLSALSLEPDPRHSSDPLVQLPTPLPRPEVILEPCLAFRPTLAALSSCLTRQAVGSHLGRVCLVLVNMSLNAHSSTVGESA